MEGIKDLVLTHDQNRIPILHAQFGALGETTNSVLEPQKGHIHMFCVQSDELLMKALEKMQLTPSSTITLFNHGKQLQNWDWLLTSNL